MTRHLQTSYACAALALFIGLGLGSARAQSATAVPKLDLNKLTGTWYQIAKLPVESEKKCLSDSTVLYALGDKPNSFQAGTFCTVKGGDLDSINQSGKMSKAGDGKLKLRRFVILSRPYWVLATDPNFEWALVGTPNHKSLWILSRTAPLSPEVYTQVQNLAAAQGFPVAKLVPVTHPKGRITLASPSANPNQIETPAPTPTQTPASPTAQ